MSHFNTHRFAFWLRSVLFAAAFLPALCSAAAYSFHFVLTINSITNPCEQNPPVPGFGCSVTVGDKWQGNFQIGVDPATLPNGSLSTPFLSMRLDTGDVSWNHCALTGTCTSVSNNVLLGYRNPLDPHIFNNDGPGFYVNNGQLSGFAGGFYGPSDGTFFDFDYAFLPGAGRFNAMDRDGRIFTGTYLIASDPATVPTPGTLSLVCIALLALACVRCLGMKKRQTLAWAERAPY